jgi:uncharacterized protein
MMVSEQHQTPSNPQTVGAGLSTDSDQQNHLQIKTCPYGIMDLLTLTRSATGVGFYCLSISGFLFFDKPTPTVAIAFVINGGLIGYYEIIGIQLFDDNSMATTELNVLGEPLKCCCTSPMTGFYRDGLCRTGAIDLGIHVVCAQVTAEFLNYTKAQGNDLSTPMPDYGFPGLKPGDRWCLCAQRWREAMDDGMAPPVDLAATHAAALKHVSLQTLQQHAISK